MSESIHFHSQGLLLNGTLHRPTTMHPPLIIGMHGLLSDSSSPKQIALAERCVARGMAYLRFDHRGCGLSQGDIAVDTTFAGRCGDLVAAVAWATERLPARTALGFFGSSYGGTVALAMATQLKAGAVVTVAAPVRSSALQGAIHDPVKPVILNNADFRRCIRFDITGRLASLHNLMVFHGERDTVVPVSHAFEIHAAAQHPKKLFIQPNGDHRMSNRRHQDHFLNEAVIWFTEHLC
jgi:alpha/beta superfamily hydrolase